MKSLLYAFFLLSIGSFCVGCGGGGGSELEGPEIGSVQAYLDDHPEEADDGDEVSEADEMGASDI